MLGTVYPLMLHLKTRNQLFYQVLFLSEYDIDLPHLEKLVIEDYAFSNTKVIELIGTSIFLI